jgi:hypothetical protein
LQLPGVSANRIECVQCLVSGPLSSSRLYIVVTSPCLTPPSPPTAPPSRPVQRLDGTGPPLPAHLMAVSTVGSAIDLVLHCPLSSSQRGRISRRVVKPSYLKAWLHVSLGGSLRIGIYRNKIKHPSHCISEAAIIYCFVKNEGHRVYVLYKYRGCGMNPAER